MKLPTFKNWTTVTVKGYECLGIVEPTQDKIVMSLQVWFPDMILVSVTYEAEILDDAPPVDVIVNNMLNDWPQEMISDMEKAISIVETTAEQGHGRTLN